MRVRSPGRIGTLSAPPVADALLAAAFLLYGLGHVWLGWVPDEGHAGGPRWLNTVVVLLTTLPLAARRSAPLAALTVIVGSFSLSQILTGAMASFFAGLMPALIAAYSVARFEPPRRAAIGVGVAALAMGALIATTPAFRRSEELLFEALLWSAAWLLGTIVRRGEQHARARARAAVLDERSRIARELHDVVAHGVSLMVVQAGGARLLLDTPDGADRVRAHLRTIEASGRQALDEMRRLLAMVRDDDGLALEPLPGMERLDALAESARSAGVELRVRVEGEPAAAACGHRPHRLPHRAGGAHQRHPATPAPCRCRVDGPLRAGTSSSWRSPTTGVARPAMPTGPATAWWGCASARRSTAGRSRRGNRRRAAGTPCASGCR